MYVPLKDRDMKVSIFQVYCHKPIWMLDTCEYVTLRKLIEQEPVQGLIHYSQV